MGYLSATDDAILVLDVLDPCCLVLDELEFDFAADELMPREVKAVTGLFSIKSQI